MAQHNYGGGLPPDFIVNLPTVTQASFTPLGGKNFLETLNAINVPNKVALPVPGNHDGSGK